MSTKLRLTSISIFISHYRKPHRSPKRAHNSVNIKDYIISGDYLNEREGTWGFTPEGLAEMEAAIQHHHESADADA